MRRPPLVPSLDFTAARAAVATVREKVDSALVAGRRESAERE